MIKAKKERDMEYDQWRKQLPKPWQEISLGSTEKKEGSSKGEVTFDPEKDGYRGTLYGKSSVREFGGTAKRNFGFIKNLS